MKKDKYILVKAVLAALNKSKVPVTTLCVETDWLTEAIQLIGCKGIEGLTYEDQQHLLGLTIQVLPTAGDRCWLYAPGFEETYQEVTFEHAKVARLNEILMSGEISVLPNHEDCMWGQTVRTKIENPAIRIELHELLKGDDVVLRDGLRLFSSDGQVIICVNDASPETGKDAAAVLMKEFGMPVDLSRMEREVKSKSRRLDSLKARFEYYVFNVKNS